jgi:undecaprenyl diphosphate synthase
MGTIVPRHIAIIMDGNGRWAHARDLPRIEGHKAGADSVREAITTCREIGVEVLTLYGFSTENWRRPRDEVETLMSLLHRYALDERRELIDHRIRVRVLGQPWRLPKVVQRALDELCRATGAQPHAMTLNLALSYGGRSEIVEAARQLAEDVRGNRIRPDDVDEAAFAARLQTAGQPDPDLLIRTSGEMRLSNFLLWQVAYTEIVVVDTLWPDFRRAHLLAAIEEFGRRSRRFGGIPGPSLEG